MPTKYTSLLRERAVLDAKIAESYGAMRLNAIDAARQLVARHDLRVDDLYVAGRLIDAKYRNPKTGQTWTGKGRVPRWIEGQDRKPFEV